MKDSPIYFTDERWEKIEAELTEIKSMLRQILGAKAEQPEPKEEIINARDVAKLLGIDIATVYAKCAKNSIPHFKMGKQYKFRLSEFNAWLEKRGSEPHIDIDQYVNKYLQKHKIIG